jgi:hypothetical protein
MSQPKVIDIPGQGLVEFPADMADSDIAAAILKTARTASAAAKPGKKEVPLLRAAVHALGRGAYTLPGIAGLDWPKAVGVTEGVGSVLTGGEYGPAAQRAEQATRLEARKAGNESPWVTGAGMIPGIVASTMAGGPAMTGPKLLRSGATALERGAAQLAPGAVAGLGVGMGTSIDPTWEGRVKEGLVSAAFGAPAAGTIAALQPEGQAILEAVKALHSTNELERKAAEKALQILTGTKNLGKRAAKVLSREDPNRPLNVGLETYRSSNLPQGYQDADALAAQLAASKQAAGQAVDEVYSPLTQNVIPLTDVQAAVNPRIQAINLPATRGGAKDAAAYVADEIATAKAAAARRVGSEPNGLDINYSISPADVHRMRMGMDTKARGWTGLARPQETAAADAVNQARGALNSDVLQTMMQRLGLGDVAHAADSRFANIAEASKLADASRTGGLFGAKTAVEQAEQMFAPAGSLVARVGSAFGPIGEFIGGAASLAQRATTNHPRLLQRQGRNAYSRVQDAYAGSPVGPPSGPVPGASVASPQMQALADAIARRLGGIRPVPVYGSDQESAR